jgi:hypothetical protein
VVVSRNHSAVFPEPSPTHLSYNAHVGDNTTTTTTATTTTTTTTTTTAAEEDIRGFRNVDFDLFCLAVSAGPFFLLILGLFACTLGRLCKKW